MEALIVEHSEALDLARELAGRQGTSVDEAVVASLRASLSGTSPASRPAPQPVRVPNLEELSPAQRADYEAMEARVREVSSYRAPGATSDHSDMYDESGLPV